MLTNTNGCFVCRSCRCWQCGGPYFGTVTDKKGKKSQYHTSGWFNCNNVDQGAPFQVTFVPVKHGFSVLSRAILRWLSLVRFRQFRLIFSVLGLTLNCVEILVWSITGALEGKVAEEDAKLQRWERISDQYATAVNAEKKGTTDKIRAKVEEMSRKMKLNGKFNDGNMYVHPAQRPSVAKGASTMIRSGVSDEVICGLCSQRGAGVGHGGTLRMQAHCEVLLRQAVRIPSNISTWNPTTTDLMPSFYPMLIG